VAIERPGGAGRSVRSHPRKPTLDEAIDRRFHPATRGQEPPWRLNGPSGAGRSVRPRKPVLDTRSIKKSTSAMEAGFRGRYWI
jgi:hypothetical protein